MVEPPKTPRGRLTELARSSQANGLALSLPAFEDLQPTFRATNPGYPQGR